MQFFDGHSDLFVCLYRVNVWRCVFYQIFCLIGVNEDSSLDQATQYETFQSGFISILPKNHEKFEKKKFEKSFQFSREINPHS